MGRMGYPIFAASQVNPIPRLREFLPLYRTARAAAGHPGDAPEDVTLLLPLYVGESPAQIREELEPSVQHFLRTAASLFDVGELREGGAVHFKKALERARRADLRQNGRGDGYLRYARRLRRASRATTAGIQDGKSDLLVQSGRTGFQCECDAQHGALRLQGNAAIRLDDGRRRFLRRSAGRDLWRVGLALRPGAIERRVLETLVVNSLNRRERRHIDSNQNRIVDLRDDEGVG